MNHNYDVLEHVAAYVREKPHSLNDFQEKMGKALHGQHRAQRWLLTLVERFLLFDPRIGHGPANESMLDRTDYEKVMRLYHEDGGFILDFLNGETYQKGLMPPKTLDYQTAYALSLESCQSITEKLNKWMSRSENRTTTIDSYDLMYLFLSLPILTDNLACHIRDNDDGRAILFFHFLFRGGFKKILECILNNPKFAMYLDFITGLMTELEQPTKVLTDEQGRPMYEVMRNKWEKLGWEKKTYVDFLYKLKRFVFDRFTDYDTWHANILEDRGELYRMLGLNMSLLSKNMPSDVFGHLLGHHVLKMMDDNLPLDNTFEICRQLLDSPHLASALKENIDRCDRHVMFLLYWFIFDNACPEMSILLADEIMGDLKPAWQILMGGEGMRSLAMTGLACKVDTKNDFIKAKKGMVAQGRKSIVSTLEEFPGKQGNKMSCLLLEEILLEEKKEEVLERISHVLDSYLDDDGNNGKKDGVHRPSLLLPCLMYKLKEKGLLDEVFYKNADGKEKQRIYQSFVNAMAEKHPGKGFSNNKRASVLYSELSAGHSFSYFENRKCANDMKEILEILERELEA